jgi:hypothetical protein
MARIIQNYQDLQDAVRLYLNRNDLEEQIPLFIYLAERKIFRWYRNQNNEKLYTIDMRADINPLDPAQVSMSNQVELPEDYLETSTLQVAIWNPSSGSPVDDPNKPVGGQPLERVSLTQFQRISYNGSRISGGVRQGDPSIFARQRDSLYLYPQPAGQAALVTHIYYCDPSGLLDTPTSDNNVLKVAPDMYIYGALLEAEPYLKPEDTEFNMIPIWKSMYEEAKNAINEQNDREAYSGSNNIISSPFGNSSQADIYSSRGWT